MRRLNKLTLPKTYLYKKKKKIGPIVEIPNQIINISKDSTLINWRHSYSNYRRPTKHTSLPLLTLHDVIKMYYNHIAALDILFLNVWLTQIYIFLICIQILLTRYPAIEEQKYSTPKWPSPRNDFFFFWLNFIVLVNTLKWFKYFLLWFFECANYLTKDFSTITIFV